MADLLKVAERLMHMDDATWARHANRWSGYTRFTALPLLALAIWSRVWIGGWAWLAVVLALAWIWLNPRVFPVPGSLDHWVSRGVLGERVYLHRRGEVRAHHCTWATGLAAASVPGVIVLGVGLWQLDAWWVIFGCILAMGPKIWFVDRMVWLYQDWLQDTGKDLGDV